MLLHNDKFQNFDIRTSIDLFSIIQNESERK
jgi:hypothetical protein